MTFFRAIIQCFKKYAVFSGRATRLEYWSFVLFQWLICIFLSIFQAILQIILLPATLPIINIFVPCFLLGCCIPNLAVSWRRLHDTGRSGLFTLLPYCGLLILFTFSLKGFVEDFDDAESVALLTLPLMLLTALSTIVLVFNCQKSQSGTNKYGEEPSHISILNKKKADSNPDNLEELRKLNQMREEKLISEEDYEKKKNKLLGL